MKENKNYFDAFKNGQSTANWERAAQDELNGANPLAKLTRHGNGWSMLPYYEQNQLRPDPLLPVSGNDFLGARSWYNCPSVEAIDAVKANHAALENLRAGADGILFELSAPVDISILLKNIEWKYCSLNFLAKKNQSLHVRALDEYIEEKKLPGDQFHGAFFGDNTVPDVSNNYFHFNGFQVEPMEDPVEELVKGWVAVYRSDAMYTSANEASERTQTHPPAFSLTLSTDFFLTIAKLRAMRMIWKKIQPIGSEKKSIFIHAYSPVWMHRDFQPHENMLKSTTAAMAGILGGCDAVTIEPADRANAMMARIARNVSNVLREESFLSKVADPLAGSYLVEDLSNQLTEAAWRSIQLLLPK